MNVSKIILYVEANTSPLMLILSKISSRSFFSFVSVAPITDIGKKMLIAY